MRKRSKQAFREAWFSRYRYKRREECKFSLDKFWPFNAIVLLKPTFVYIKVEVEKNDTTIMPELQIKLALGDYNKIAIWWGRSDTLDRAGCKFIKGDLIFIVEEMSNFLAVLNLSPGFLIKV